MTCCGLRVQKEVMEMKHAAGRRADAEPRAEEQQQAAEESRAATDAAADIIGISQELLEADGTWESKLSLWKQVGLDCSSRVGYISREAAGGLFRP